MPSPKPISDLKLLINRNLDAVGRTEHTALTTFTDGCRALVQFGGLPIFQRSDGLKAGR